MAVEEVAVEASDLEVAINDRLYDFFGTRDEFISEEHMSEFFPEIKTRGQRDLVFKCLQRYADEWNAGVWTKKT